MPGQRKRPRGPECAGPPRGERRSSPRRPPRRPAYCHLVSVAQRLFCAAELLDVSAGGARLRAARRPAADGTVVVSFHDLAREFFREVPLRVTRVAEASDGGYVFGGAWAGPLTAADLAALHGDPPAPD